MQIIFKNLFEVQMNQSVPSDELEKKSQRVIYHSPLEMVFVCSENSYY